ncbi:hypothetical protein BOTBODRAFT_108051 [Botryobasidium botryosum FD-172 SS1]|uniref:NADP-dependent oxidoreductase domain-containing protein n=1 Tax=Botryobasidium botryosum (strain FD-172 SS1) TaxID=930990 RepID=A0A067MMI9_BOTB1|nr:hypothetical protein BOTBODRAFT_108051 [Botryobasidium botryosum FD-172 SS1]
MPVLGLGVWKNRECTPACLEALRVGYRHIDTAQIYRNEEACGQAIRESGLSREDIFITSKCVSKTHGYEKTLRGIDKSLRKFGLDYIDLFLVHDPISGKEKRLATYRALLDAREAGKIRTVGVSNYNIRHIEEIKEAGLEIPAVNQIELHPLCQQRPIVEYCTQNSVLVQAYTPLLEGKFQQLIPSLHTIADKYNKDSAQVLIRWSIQKGFVPLPKSANPARIASNADVFDFELSEEDMAALDALDKGKEGAVTWNPVDVP